MARNRNDWEMTNEQSSNLENKVNKPENDAAIPNKTETSLLQKLVGESFPEFKRIIQVQSKEPNSSLYSVKSFEALNLRPNLLKGIYAMGFNFPSKFQEIVLPTLIANPPRNMIAESQSGTGKTVAFVLAMLNRVNSTQPYPQVLCMDTSYEGVIQIGEVAAKMARFCPDIKFKYAVRGQELPRGSKITDHVIIGTAGKMLDWGLKFRMFDLNKINTFVLRDADLMISRQGYQDQCIRILKMLQKNCQIMFFASKYDTPVMEFAEVIVPNPVIIRLPRKKETFDNVNQYSIKCRGTDEMYDTICKIYRVVNVGQAILFCQLRRKASWLSFKMSKDAYSVALIHGELTVEERIIILDRFKAGLVKILITTDVLPRRMVFENVTLVVNFDMPVDFEEKADYESYLHRVRRIGNFGTAINLIDSAHAMQICKDIEAYFTTKIILIDAEEINKIVA